ncbi:hypothetical protein CEK27_000602 [Fusarium fujikuroi]|uniref:Uncharacterized protein n=1 Tax=Fusarium fujikuroi TaxID=5127 RepID=A0A9Q9RLI2_FUSFU|nr:hypothetical protein CEK27_000602 [Fusarium fujikuroi]VTT67055.1 unnamed protein product [Fusarium fujikuroi]VZH93677.1 unnamed protein product [Fusarium fujikuroi]
MDMRALPVAMVGSAGRSVWTDVADALAYQGKGLIKVPSYNRGRTKIGLHSPFKAPVAAGQSKVPRSMQFMSACIHLSIGQLNLDAGEPGNGTVCIQG